MIYNSKTETQNKACVNADEYLRLHMRNYAETKGWQVSLRISNHL